MKRSVRKVLIIANMQKEDAGRLVDSICSLLESIPIKTQLVCFKGKPEVSQVDDDVDLAFSLGGDGTVLFSARLVAGRRIPILAVNIGDFGFITEVAKDEWESAFHGYLDGTIDLSARIMLQVEIRRNGGETSGPYNALNDVVVGSRNISKVMKLGVRVSDTPLGRYRADGLIVATPTGSTAYSMAAGGPILMPEMEAMVLNPICPFTLSNRPLVIPGSEYILVEVEEQRLEIVLTLDGQTTVPLYERDTILVTQAPERVLIIRSEKRNFLDVLRAKLHWAGGPDA